MLDGPLMVRKLCAADVELGNLLLGRHGAEHTDTEAAQLLLRQIPGVPQYRMPPKRSRRSNTGQYASRFPNAAPRWVASFDPYDWNRKFLASTGGSAYIDQTHAELCLPEVLSAEDHAASWHGMLRIAQRALEAANRTLPAEERLCVLVDNTNGVASWGGHLNFLVTRRAWENIFHRKLHYQSFLMALQISSIVITGQGKVGASDGRDPVLFQLTQRGDFFYTLVAEQTTYRRPLLNTRDEPLCGANSDLARVHCIFFDSNLCPVAHLLKVGIMQIGLAMIEAEQVDPQVSLDDPLSALLHWGHDPTLQARARLLSGASVNAIELQEVFCAAAQRFVEDGACDGVVPQAREIVALWAETLSMLRAGDVHALSSRLDWALKLSILTRAMRQRPDLTWSSPEIRYLDQMYANLDPNDGLFWAYLSEGRVEKLVSDERIEHLRRNPPDDTRAWTRATLLRTAPPGSVTAMDWDYLTFEYPLGSFCYRRVQLANPLQRTRAETEPLFQRYEKFDELLDALGAERLVPADDKHGWGSYSARGERDVWIIN